jgi:hypothetical protein
LFNRRTTIRKRLSAIDHLGFPNISPRAAATVDAVGRTELNSLVRLAALAYG